MSEIRRRVLISGMVQGVWFRAYTRDAARNAGVTGWVRNLPDGRVEAVFQGTSEQVSQVIDWCRKGSPGSWVKDVEVHEESPGTEFSSFEIMYHRGAF
jgi:acylphosphatase